MARPLVEGAPAPLGNFRHLALSGFWFGISFHWLPIDFVLVQSQVRDLLPHEQQGLGIGLLGLAAFFAITVPPLVGMWSDHHTTRWGRRRPFMVMGAVGDVLGLGLLMTASTYPQMLFGYVIIQIFNNVAGGAYAGIIPDVVPGPEFGKASGFLGAMTQLGGVAGLLALVIATLVHQLRVIYIVIGAVLLLSLLPTLWAARSEGRAVLPPATRKPFPESVKDFLQPLARGDFAWVVFTRLMVVAGINAVGPFLSPFFADVVKVGNPDQFTAIWLLILYLTATLPGVFGGAASDRLGRKIFVYSSGALQAAVALFYIVFYPSQVGLVLALGAVFGIGFGLYFAVDWALACDTLPDRTRSAKDMGLFHVAFTLPKFVIQPVGGYALDLFNRQAANSGYRVVFGSAVFFFLLGTVLVSRIRSVR